MNAYIKKRRTRHFFEVWKTDTHKVAGYSAGDQNATTGRNGKERAGAVRFNRMGYGFCCWAKGSQNENKRTCKKKLTSCFRLGGTSGSQNSLENYYRDDLGHIWFNPLCFHSVIWKNRLFERFFYIKKLLYYAARWSHDRDWEFSCLEYNVFVWWCSYLTKRYNITI